MSEREQRLAGNKAAAVCGRLAATVAGVRGRDAKTAKGAARVGRTEAGLHPAALPAFYWSISFCQLPRGKPGAFSSLEEPHIVSASSKRTLSCGLKTELSSTFAGSPQVSLTLPLDEWSPAHGVLSVKLAATPRELPRAAYPTKPTALADHLPFQWWPLIGPCPRLTASECA